MGKNYGPGPLRMSWSLQCVCQVQHWWFINMPLGSLCPMVIPLPWARGDSNPISLFADDGRWGCLSLFDTRPPVGPREGASKMTATVGSRSCVLHGWVSSLLHSCLGVKML